MTQIEALNYVLDRLLHETLVRPERQPADVLERKLAAIRALSELRDSLAVA